MSFVVHDRRQKRPVAQVLLLLITLLILATTGYSQSAQSPLPPPSDPAIIKDVSKDTSKDDPRFGSPEAEMRSKLEIKEEKKKYDEHVARAKEVSQLATQISESYETHKALSSDDGKRLERLEKLTKRIRNDAGGENDAHEDTDEVPSGMEARIKKVSSMAEELQKLVEKTPRNVISAAVIDQANKLLCIIQHVRGTSR
jgi:flagellar biosynthesis/type III secretory pathway protein FliH